MSFDKQYKFQTQKCDKSNNQNIFYHLISSSSTSNSQTLIGQRWWNAERVERLLLLNYNSYKFITKLFEHNCKEFNWTR